MANNTQVAQEYLLIKCFLYKYTPVFTPKAGVPSSLSTFKPYSIDLDDTKYFTKYDISSYVSSYTFEQNINETTYSWSVDLQDQALSYSTINHLKVMPPSGNTMTGGLSFSTDPHALNLLSLYETGANTFANNDYNEFGSNTPIFLAKTNRGLTPGPLTVQNTNLNSVLSTKPGLRLSDLIQEYDFVSLFLYKNTTPLSDIYGDIALEGPANNRFFIFRYAFTNSDQISYGNAFNIANYNTLSDTNLQYETVLLSKVNGKTLFSNEFNGFVIQKNMTSSINQVDKVSIAGNGWSRLFGSTRRAVKSSLFQNSLYQAGQVLSLDAVTSLESIYAGKPINKIIQDLFDLVYKIDFKIAYTDIDLVSSGIDTASVNNSGNGTNLTVTTATTTTPVTSSILPPSTSPIIPSPSASDFEVNVSDTTVSGLQPTAFISPITTIPTTTTVVSVTSTNPLDQLQGSTPAGTKGVQINSLLTNSFFNITSLVVANSYPANFFNLPQYLFASAMKLRNFAYIEPLIMPPSLGFIDGVINLAAKNQASSNTLSSQAIASNSQANYVQVSPENFQQTTQNYDPSQQVLNYTGILPVFVDPQIQNLQAYFSFLGSTFSTYSPELKTPYEIFDDIRANSFVEMFEQPSGQFVVRSPQYNNMAVSVKGRSDIGLVISSNLNILSSSYNETVDNLLTKLFSRYTPNVIPISELQEFGYCDGKLLIQNGLLETTVAASPNAATSSLTDSDINNGGITGIFGWAEYNMEVRNARLKTGSITCDLDTTIQVGQTFIDETKFKFSYIVGVSKQVSVSGTATMSLHLSYVRDAFPIVNTNQNGMQTISNIAVDLLPVLTDIEKSFATGS